MLWGFTVAAESNGRVLVDATDFFLRDGHGAAESLGALSRRPQPQRLLHAAHQSLPEEHRDRSHADVLERSSRGRGGGGPTQGPPIARTAAGRGLAAALLRHRRQRHPDRRGRHPARALLARRASRLPLHPALRRSARRLRRPQLRRLQHARSASPMVQRFIDRHRLEKRDPNAADQRAREADPILGRSRRARGRPESAHRRRELVEPGVRGRRLPQRLQGRRPARRRRPHGHPLQHDQLGPSLHPRLEHAAAPSAIRAPARSSRPP